MINKRVEDILEEKGVLYRILEFNMPFISTEDSARVIQTPIESIAKTLVFEDLFGALVIIASGTAKVDNKKFKDRFGFRPLMLKADELRELTGFEAGSVSPVGISSNKVKVYMDVSVKRLMEGFVYPSAGTEDSAIEITAADLYKAASCKGTVDVCK